MIIIYNIPYFNSSQVLKVYNIYLIYEQNIKYNKIKMTNANGKILEILMQILWKEFALVAEGCHKIKLEFLKFCNVAEEFLFYYTLCSAFNKAVTSKIKSCWSLLGCMLPIFFA